MSLRLAAAIIFMLLGSIPVAFAQEDDAPSEACASREHRQFDFWIGFWEVTTPEGEVAGTNEIDRVLDGCALRERWQGRSGMTGTSLNAYDPHTGTWHQTWVDDRGGLLLLVGGLEEGSMVLSGEMRDEKGPETHRITWTPLDEGQVGQLWEVRRGAEDWQVVFDGLYTRQESGEVGGAEGR
ncbi:MAG: hypothetical protein ACREMD_04585 [Gemmatimonadota bacterium]